VRTLRLYFVIDGRGRFPTRFRIGWERHESLFIWSTHFIEVNWQ
jgi:hypothetical protein